MAPQRTGPDVDLSMLLNQASYALTNRLTAALGEDLGISVRIYCVLAKAFGQERTQAELAEAAFLDKTTMVVAVDDMEAQGLAERRPSPTDRRVRRIALTPAGEAMLHRADAIVQGVYDELLGAVSPAERATFLAVLDGLVAGPLAAPFHLEKPQVRRRRMIRH